MMKSSVSFVLMLWLTSSLSLHSHQDSLNEFCWRDTNDRGIGVLPSLCPSNMDKIGVLCYSQCLSGYTRVGFDCLQDCLPGWTAQGYFCRLYDYSRGTGFPWKFGDAFNDSGMITRCQAANGKGNCEKYGTSYYPKCKTGYSPSGCCTCKANTPDCKGLGYNSGIGSSCTKYLKIGDPKHMQCTNGQIYDAGLCYDACKTGFTGVGPACYASAPSSWSNCGLGAAKTTQACTSTVFDQVSSVGNLALNIAVAGINSADLSNQFDQLKKLIASNDSAQNLISSGQGKFPLTQPGSITDILKADQFAITPEDIVRASSQIAALAGASASTYQKCSQISV